MSIIWDTRVGSEKKTAWYNLVIEFKNNRDYPTMNEFIKALYPDCQLIWDENELNVLRIVFKEKDLMHFLLKYS